MFEDENEQGNSGKERIYHSNKEALTSNSAVKAAIFVFGLMICIIVIYILILGTDSGGTGAGTTSPPASTGQNTEPGETSGTVETEPPTDSITSSANTSDPGVSFELKKGSSDPKVKQLQQLLKDKKYLDASVALTENFGEKTEEAVKLFQKEHSLPENGIVNAELYAMIESAEERIVLKKGDKSQKVKELQLLLIEKKYLNIKVEETTENFGAQTEAAVKLFQQKNGLSQTGIVTNSLYELIRTSPENTP